MFTFDLYSAALEQHHDSLRCTGHQPRPTGEKRPEVDGVKAVDILSWIYSVYNSLRVDMVRKR